MRLWPKSVGDRIREAFAFLTEVHGYRLIADSDGGMGGSLTYRSDALWIAVEWDRSDPWLEFSPARSPAGKFDWDLVDQLLRSAPHFEGAGVPSRTAPVAELAAFLREQSWANANLLLMSSGTFDGLNLTELATEITG